MTSVPRDEHFDTGGVLHHVPFHKDSRLGDLVPLLRLSGGVPLRAADGLSATQERAKAAFSSSARSTRRPRVAFDIQQSTQTPVCCSCVSCLSVCPHFKRFLLFSCTVGLLQGERTDHTRVCSEWTLGCASNCCKHVLNALVQVGIPWRPGWSNQRTPAGSKRAASASLRGLGMSSSAPPETKSVFKERGAPQRAEAT